MVTQTPDNTAKDAKLRVSPLPVKVVDRPGSITLFVGGQKVASAWGPALDDPAVWFWWSGRTQPYRIGGAIYDLPPLDGREAALSLIDGERQSWERHEASLYHPDHGSLVDEWWIAEGPAGVSCWSCGESVAGDRHIVTIVLHNGPDDTRHYVCANCEIWFEDDDDEADTRSSTGGTQ